MKNQLSLGSVLPRLFSLEEKIAEKAAEFKFRWTRSPQRIQSRLATLEPQTIKSIESSLDFFLHTLQLASKKEINPWNDQEFISLSMKAMGLTFPSDFIGLVANADIIEGYDMERRQIFRNLHFMEISSYSLLEVLSYEWPSLFERPSYITDCIIKAAEVDMWSINKTISSHIPKHFVQETLSGKPQALQVQHRYFSPLFAGPNIPAGCLSVCQAKTVVSEINLKEDNLRFI